MFRVVGYLPWWERNRGYRPDPETLARLTHLAHFSVLPTPSGRIRAYPHARFPDPEVVTAAHAAGVRAILVAGTGDDPEVSAAFAAMAGRRSARAAFVRTLARLVTAHGYDGVTLDWEFPESPADRANLVTLAADLRVALGPVRTLAVDAPASAWYGRWFDVPALARLVDWVAVMTYALHGPAWSDHAGHHAPLHAPAGAEGCCAVSVASAAAYYLDRGLPRDKLVIGLPFFGVRFDGASAPGRPLATRAGGSLDHPNLAALSPDAWQPRRDPVARAPYLVARTGAGMISYDDAPSITEKVRYARQLGLGGVFVWSLGKDVVAGRPALLPAVTEGLAPSAAPATVRPRAPPGL